MTFLHPKILFLLLLLPVCIAWYVYRRREGYATLLSPGLQTLEGMPASPRVWLRHTPFVLRMLALAAAIVALARPQSRNAWNEQDVEGIDIMLTMDISTSMEAMDFTPNRMEAAREVALSFVKQRPSDNIGLVAFSGESFTVCPLTTDHATLTNRLRELYPGMLEDRTAIGLGLATAINRLKDSPSKSKVIILLTDGVNNAGEISPRTAAELAVPYGIVIYCIGMGSATGVAPMPMPASIFGQVVRNQPVDLDEDMMREIADLTDGVYFRATDNNSLSQIYSKIDKLEKTKISKRSYQAVYEQYQLFVLVALGLLLLELLLRNTLFRLRP